MKLLFQFLLSIFFYFASQNFGFSQSTEPLSLKQANKLYYNKAYNDAIPKYLYTIKKDTSLHQAIINLADCYRLINDSENSEVWYKKVVTLNDSEPIHQFYLGEVLLKNKKYDEAKKWFESYNSNVNDDSRGHEYLQALKQIRWYYKDSSFVKVQKLNINSLESDFSPVEYDHGLIFTSSRKRMPLVERTQAWTGKNFFNLYYARSKDSIAFEKPKLFAPELQINYNNGPLCISKDAKTIYFTRNNPNGNSSDEIIKLEIYESHLLPDNEHWSTKLIPFRWNSNTYNCAHPALSADGKKLYFSSDMKSGYGGMDLYVCTREGETWSEPDNLGPKINTAGNEVFPFIDENNKLYFSSSGHGGLGGLDIFYSNLLADGSYSPAENIGAPINSNADDFGVTIKSKKGYFSSNREEGEDDNIYYFINTKPNKIRFQIKLVDSVTHHSIANGFIEIKDVLTKEFVPVTENRGLLYADLIPGFDYIFEADAEYYNSKTIVPSIYSKNNSVIIPMRRAENNKVPTDYANICLTGYVYTLSNGKKVALSNTPIMIVNDSTKDKVVEGKSDAYGRYKICNIPVNGTFKIQTSYSNYFVNDRSIRTQTILYDSIIYQDFDFDKIMIGKGVPVTNLQFKQGKSELAANAAIEVNKLIERLRDNPKIVVELGVHTDCRGNAEDNLNLSDDRAQVLKNYILSSGIDSKRVIFTGYGESVPLNKCECEETVVIPCSEQEHQQNNRVEFKVIGFFKNGIIVSE